HFFFVFFIILPPLISTLFPYTTLFRSPGFWPHLRGWGSLEYRRVVFRVYFEGEIFCPFKWTGCVRVSSATRQHHPICFSVIHKRSEEHTSELQSRGHLVCRLLLEKKKK